MNQIDVIKSHIDYIENKNGAVDLKDCIIRTIRLYENEIPSLKRTSFYMSSALINKSMDVQSDYCLVLSALKKRCGELMSVEEKLNRELEIAKYNSLSVNVNQQQNNNQTQNTNISITLEQANEVVNKIPESLLSEEEKDCLISELAIFDNATKTKDKDKIWDKAKGILAYIGDKGVDVGIALLPLLPFIQRSMEKIQF